MAEENDRNYNEEFEEEPTPAASDLPYASGEDDCTDFLNILLYLVDEIKHARPVPLTNSRMLNASLCQDIIGDLQNTVPAAIQYAKQVLDEKNRILEGAQQAAQNRIESANVRANAAIDDATDRANRIVADAQAHADNIVKDAEVRARAMIDQNTIKIAAQNEARDIVNEASSEATERRMQAAEYCDKLLRDAEETLRAAYEDVRRNRQNIGQSRSEDRG